MAQPLLKYNWIWGAILQFWDNWLTKELQKWISFSCGWTRIASFNDPCLSVPSCIPCLQSWRYFTSRSPLVMDSSSTRNWRSSTFLWGQLIKIQVILEENAFKLTFQRKSDWQWQHSHCTSKLPGTWRRNLSQEASEGGPVLKILSCCP